jgi:hypothetical protein
MPGHYLQRQHYPEIHDWMLAHGSPPVRLLRTLISF